LAQLDIRPTHKPVADYFSELQRFSDLGVSHETAVRSAFQSVLAFYGRQAGWTLVPEWPLRRRGAPPLRVDGALVDSFRLAHGYWEAKDDADDLAAEARRKLEAGYPDRNILFQSPRRALLVQNGRVALDQALDTPRDLIDVLQAFFAYRPAVFTNWESAVEEFQDRVPELGRTLVGLIRKERRENEPFRGAFERFFRVCRDAINPNLSEAAVEEMLIQHLLTERILRTVFQNADFTRRNVIAAEIENVIDTLTARAFSREEFLQPLDRFYRAIEDAAGTIDDFAQKQAFLNRVYEKFFQGYSVAVADTHGIVYTPPAIVAFIVNTVSELLHNEFGKTLGDSDVHIIDPFVGTGNFIIHIMDAIRRSALGDKYARELHCNEVMLLPYYVASMNIEHEHYDITGAYAPFEGICLVDTFDVLDEGELAGEQIPLIHRFNAENTKRVERQKRSPIFVILGNPPYNANQINENDNNKNRKYPVMDRRVTSTYGEASSATLRNKLGDPYVKAFRWATDRILKTAEGIVAFVTNNSFTNDNAFDGMRAHLVREFSAIYHLNLKGNARSTAERRRREGGNVFDDAIRVSVGITFLVKKKGSRPPAKVYVHSVDDYLSGQEKQRILETAGAASKLAFEERHVRAGDPWLSAAGVREFQTFPPLGLRRSAGTPGPSHATKAIFGAFSLGVSTNRDEVAYDFSREVLAEKVDRFCDAYNSEVARYQRHRPKDLDNFLRYDRVKWSETLKRKLKSGVLAQFDVSRIRDAMYRPFVDKYLYYDPLVIDRPGLFDGVFSHGTGKNEVLCVSDKGFRSPFAALMVNVTPDLHICASTDGYQCFPRQRPDAGEMVDNITDWAADLFQESYRDDRITKDDIFYYVFAVLNHAGYRSTYAENLRTELAHIPLVREFDLLCALGRRLATIETDFRSAPLTGIERVENRGKRVEWRLHEPKLSRDHGELRVNDFLTLRIPASALAFRVGNRSPIEWFIDQAGGSQQWSHARERHIQPEEDVAHIERIIGASVAADAISREIASIGLDSTKALPLRRRGRVPAG
jgi:predicted helicase